MPTTIDGIAYPSSSGNPNLWKHFQNLAESVQAKFAADEAFSTWTPTFDAGFLTFGSGATVEVLLLPTRQAGAR